MIVVNRCKLLGNDQQRSHPVSERTAAAQAAVAGDRMPQEHTQIGFSGTVSAHLGIFHFQIIGDHITDTVILLFPAAGIQPAWTADIEPVTFVPQISAERTIEKKLIHNISAADFILVAELFL
jgi:hypothetical protein